MFCPRCGSQGVDAQDNPFTLNDSEYYVYVAVEVSGQDSSIHDCTIKEVHCNDCKHIWYDSTKTTDERSRDADLE